MHRIAALLLAAVIAAPLHAAFKKPYFAATKPGSWAKYDVKDTQNGFAYTLTYTRLPDEGKNIVLEVRAEFPPSMGAPMSITRYEVPSTFAFDRNGISFARAVTAVSTSTPDTEPSPLPAEVVATMTKETTDYAASAAFKASEKDGDRYGYSFKGASGATDVGELVLSDKVPFGLVRHTATYKDAEGKTTAVTQYVLTDSGTSAPAAPPARKPAETAELSLQDALMKELVDAEVVVLDEGKRLQLTLGNGGEQPVKIHLKKGSFDLVAADPIELLQLAFTENDMVIEVPTNEKTVIEVAQRPGRAVVDGKFRLLAYQGQPLFTGSVTMGRLEK